MPDGTPSDPGAVIFISAEDDASDTLRPRLEAAGARLDKITLVGFTLPNGNPLTLPEHLPELEGEIRRVNAKLIVLDPLAAFLTDATDSHRDQSVRRMLAELAAVAERTDAAIIIIRHLNKRSDGGNPLYRSAGSLAFVAAVRSALLIATDQDDPEEDTGCKRRVLAPLKWNLTRMPNSLAFKIVENENGAPRIEWDASPADRSARDLLRERNDSNSDADALVEATAFLAAELSSGPRPSDEVFKSAAAHNISAMTLKRARSKLGVRSRKRGMRGGWEMLLDAATLDASKNGVPE